MANITGSETKPLDPINVFDFTFSRPFSENSTVLRNAQTPQQRKHRIPDVPSKKCIFIDAINGASITWQGIREDASKLATGLRELLAGEKGPYDRVSPVVLIHIANCVQFVPLVLSVFAAGFTASLANPMLTPTELRHIISLARPAAIITSHEGWQSIEEALKTLDDSTLSSKLISQGRIFIHSAAGYRTSSIKGTRGTRELLRPLRSEFTASKLTNDSYRKHTALILWSSGTTGKSKGVCLSHEAVLHNTIGLWHAAPQFDADERWIMFVPAYHIFGLAVVALLAPACGATVHVMPKFDPRRMLDIIEREKITCLHLAPPVALLLAKSPMVEGRDCSSVKFALSGGAPLGPDVIEMVYKRLGIMVFMGYGLSEGGSVSQQYAANWEELTQHLGDSGRPIPGIQLKVTNTEDPGQTLLTGEEGEVLIKSRANMIGYLNNPEATQEVLDDERWFRTGDVGKIDKTGSLWLTDRMKEMIKVKGLQVSPADLEAILCASPGISDAGVVATYHPGTASEYPRAYLVPSQSTLVDLCKSTPIGSQPHELLELSKHVRTWMEARTAKYKWLKGGVVFVTQITKSPSGKILRRMLKDVKGVEVNLYPENRTATPKL